MKKIMFNDRYGLTQAVLDGRKTMTRRVNKDEISLAFCEIGHTNLAIYRAAYEIGEVVAVAQSYKNCGLKETYHCVYGEYATGERASKGWDNKMYVKAKLMPHHIRITNIRVERLQDISDEDCLREGIEEFYGNDTNKCILYNYPYGLEPKFTPRDAFASLINKVSGKGTWKRNPYVFVYEFELVD